MIRIKKLTLFILLIVTSFCQGQTILEGGIISGELKKEDSPFVVNGNLLIEEGASLSIEAGVKILFDGHYELRVEGHLNCSGDSLNYVTFSTVDSTKKWQGIRFDPFQMPITPSVFTFTIIENAHAYSENGQNTYDNCGGGLFLNGGSNVLIENSILQNNKAFWGGGILCLYSNLTINNSIIQNNITEESGTLSFGGTGKYILNNCLITNNKAKIHSVLAISHTSKVSIINNTICNNISLNNNEPSILCQGSVEFYNTILYYNQPGSILFDDGGSKGVFLNCNIENGIEALTHLYGMDNIIYESNIETLPYFVSVSESNYHLGISACINAGASNDFEILENDIDANPRIFNEPDAMIDIGAYEYQDTIPNRIPELIKKRTHKLLKNIPKIVKLYYHEPDIKDSISVICNSINSNVQVKILEINHTDILLKITPSADWVGEAYVQVSINDNTNTGNSTSMDIIKVIVSNNFEGIIDSFVEFKDTVNVIGNIHITDSGNLLIHPGTYINFKGFYNILVNGRLNASGNKSKPITFTCNDTAIVEKNNVVFKSGWGGMKFDGILPKDTILIQGCIIENTGIDNSGGYPYCNGTITIENSSNILIKDCNFRNNFGVNGEFFNSGVHLYRSKNIHIYNSIFENGFTADNGTGNCIVARESELIADSCIFKNSSRYNLGYHSWYEITISNSTFKLSNCKFYNNNYGRYLVYITQSSSIIEKNSFHDNKISAIDITSGESLIRNNFILNNRLVINSRGSITKFINNLVVSNGFANGSGNCFGLLNFESVSNSTIIANNTIVGNYQDNSCGNVIYCSYAWPRIFNNILWNNQKEGVGFYNGAGLGYPDPKIENNIMEIEHESNIFSDPMFTNKELLDFTLTKNSPAINSGLIDTTTLFLPMYDLAGNLRIDTIYSRIDIGAYEFFNFDTINSNIDYVYRNLGSLNLYPNPATSKIKISGISFPVQYRIYNGQGKIVDIGLYNSELINIKNLRKGFYIIVVEDIINNRYKGTFVKD